MVFLLSLQDLADNGIGAIIGVITLITTVISSKSVAKALTHRLVKFIKGDLVTFDELVNDDFFIKVNAYRATDHYDLIEDFEHNSKHELFVEYIKCICDALREFGNGLLQEENLRSSAQAFKGKLVAKHIDMTREIDIKILSMLRARNDDRKAVMETINKLKSWRADHIDICMRNAVEIVTNGERMSVVKLRGILIVYMTGLDYLVLNGYDSFNKLNGQINAFVKNDNL
jgi:hypothetical protein